MPIEQNVTVLKLSYYQSKAKDTRGYPAAKLVDTSYNGNTYKAASSAYMLARESALENWFYDMFPDHPPLETRQGYRVIFSMIEDALNALGYRVDMPYDADVIVVIKKGAI
jgi:hypothetical protein